MKIKIYCSDDKVKTITKELIDGKFEIVNTEADVYLFESGYKRDKIIGKYNDEYLMIKPDEIIFVEGEGNDVSCHHINGKQYFIKEKLYEIAALLQDQGLIRVNKSFIINVNYIKLIKSSLNMKYVLTMTNDAKIIVTRTYYFMFKTYIGL